ncbi:energy transducer TonB [Marilutibacter maris]|uniref:Energy transducer TonB n=1 Tax=Marilutibacter maris TaxID=1605891 RepID=A0A2U9TCT3_9GAMM|nr:energy transducer TonB [Lysobacter maris]AWV07379.1 energy transducer TonB [Lysobacter maris]KAB8161686.1 TonB family protein [Lysobacter maris]
MSQASSSSRLLLAGLAIVALLLGLYVWKMAPDDVADAAGNDITIGPIDATEIDGQSLTPASADPDNASRNRRARPVVGSAVPPAFPIEAIKRGESGKVILEVVVDPRGQATAVRVATSSGSLILDEAAREAVGRWQFEPALEENEPVADTIEIPVDFEPAG